MTRKIGLIGGSLAARLAATSQIVDRGLRRVYNPEPAREDFPSRQAYRKAQRDWTKKYG